MRRPAPSLLTSVVLHLVLGAALLHVLLSPRPLSTWLRLPESPARAEEHIEYVRVAPVDSAVAPAPGRSGGDGRPPVAGARPAPPLVAPSGVPAGVPAPQPGAPKGGGEGGSGEIVGEGGPTRGVRPSYGDPRIWVPPAAPVPAPKTQKQRLDSAFAARIEEYQDSLARVGPRRAENAPPEWLIERNGKKYGLKPGKVVLGDREIPSALLGLLPFNTSNPLQLERDRAMARMRQDLLAGAQRAMNEEEFRTAVKRIRERKERERARGRESEAPVVATPGAGGPP